MRESLEDWCLVAVTVVMLGAAAVVVFGGFMAVLLQFGGTPCE